MSQPSNSTRRAFLGAMTRAGAVLGLPGGLIGGTDLGGASGRPQAFDLLVVGGHVIDPASGIDGPRDIGVTGGRIARVAEGIPRSEGRRIIDASGKIVCPGLIDAHVHVYDGVARSGVQPEAVGVVKGVTTLIDGGSAGATTFPGFREYVVERARTRVYALLNISTPGMTVPHELADLRYVDPEAAVRTIEAHRDVIVGIKVRMLAGIPGGGDVEVMHRTREAADATEVPIMVHIGGQSSPLSRILGFLRPGDVGTHALRGRGGIVAPDGTVDPAVAEARANGIHLDVGHGSGNLDFDAAEGAIAQDVRPTVISSDVHRGNVTGPVFGLPTTLSKFVAMGLPLPEVVRAATSTPADVFGLNSGTLAEGAVADLSVLEMASGSYEFEDSGEKRRGAPQRLVPYATLLGGREYGSITGS